MIRRTQIVPRGFPDAGVLLLGVAALSGCGGSAPPVALGLFIALVGLGGWVMGCTGAPGNPGGGGTDECFAGDDFARSLPPGTRDGWVSCCLQGQSRLCPAPSPHVACNYGSGVVHNADGTCGPRFADAAVDGPSSDAGTDAGVGVDADSDSGRDAVADSGSGAVDAPVFEGCLGDPLFDLSMPVSSAAPGWPRCCLRGETRLCPPPIPILACNYGQATFCDDGTCVPGFGGVCPTADASAGTETGP